MRNALVSTLFDIAKKDKKVVLLTGDIGYSVLDKYREELKEQFINAGIAEQNMTSVAAGMAHGGLIAITYSIGNFNSIRCIEQIRNDICYHNLNVKIVSIGAGMAYGAAGISHHMTEDISILRSIPNIVIFSPADPKEAELVMKLAYSYHGPCYIRLGKGGEKTIHRKDLEAIAIGDMIEIEEGEHICIFTTSAILSEAYNAFEYLKEKYDLNIGIVSFPTIKPINKERFKEFINKYQLIVTLEEHVLSGGFGSSILEYINDLEIKGKDVVRIGIDDRFTGEVGNQEYLRRYYEIDREAIVKKIMEKLGKI